MLNIVLFEPEIPPNTGNIIRLCANTGCQLHLIKPFGFELQDKLLRRAGLDYHEWANVIQHDDYEAFLSATQINQLYAFSTRGKRVYCDIDFVDGDALMFGPETRGLPLRILDSLPADHLATLPMRDHSRSLNLSNSVSIAVYEAWRQLGFKQF